MSSQHALANFKTNMLKVGEKKIISDQIPVIKDLEMFCAEQIDYNMFET